MSSLPLSTVVARLRAAGCVFAEDEAELLTAAAGSQAELAGMLDRRVAGQPLEHILGWVEFCGLRVAVAPGVFVPRRRTEFLARRAAALIAPGAVVVDLCCGSGAVGAVITAAVPDVELYAVDIDPPAVACARGNLPAGATVLCGDLYEPLPATLRGRVTVLVANAPYVPTDSIELLPPEARLYEPLVALDGGPDGLSIQHRVLAGAEPWLADGAHVLIETSDRQSPTLADTATRYGLTPTVSGDPDLYATVLIARAARRTRQT